MDQTNGMATCKLAGQAVVVQQDSTFYFVLNDHLGSANGLMATGGLLVSGNGRLFIEYSDGTIVDVWQNPTNFSGSQPVSSSFTPPAGAASFQVVIEVALDRGWAAFQDVTLTGWSETIPVAAGSQYVFSLTIAGELQATAGQGGRVRVQYDSGSPTLLWQNPTNLGVFAQPLKKVQSRNSPKLHLWWRP